MNRGEERGYRQKSGRGTPKYREGGRINGGSGSGKRSADRRPLTPEERLARRRRIRQQQIKQAKRIRFLAVFGVLTLCLLTAGLVFARLRSGEETESPVLAESMQETKVLQETETMAEVASLPEETAAPKSWEKQLPDIGAIYGIFVHNVGWSHFFADASYCMAPVDNYVTAFRATVHNQPEDMTGTIEYSVNLSGSGWLDWTENAAEAGDSAGAMPLEAIAIRLTGELGEYYDVHYSVLQNQAWTDWKKNGEEAGEAGVAKRVDGVRISIEKKGAGGISYAGGIDPTKPMVALTYDDGPSATVTPVILEALKQHGGKATFFMVGKQAERNMGLVRQMTEQGCEVANHTYDHTLMTKVSPEELSSQLARTNQVVSDASGVSPVLMRPCGGARSDAGMNVVGAISMPAVLWSIDTLDWKTRDVQSTVNAVLEKVKDGDIVLMHDLYEATGEASKILIPELINRGYQLVTVSELASYRGGMLPGKTYSRFRPLTP